MYSKIDLSGSWNLQLDEEKQGLKLPFNDVIALPGTTSHAKKGKKNQQIEIGCLTDEYLFEGYAWFSREIEISDDLSGKVFYLHLERTRMTTVWIDDQKVGVQNSLNTPHHYDVSNYLSSGKHQITILVDNTNYPTRGGHLTSQDTQTNWNGITGKIELQVFNQAYLSDVQVYPNAQERTVMIKSKVIGASNGNLSVSAMSFNSGNEHIVEEKSFSFTANEVTIIYQLGENALLWSEYEPNLYKLKVNLGINGMTMDTNEVTFGLRDFKTEGLKFTINGRKTFLRGKHDGLIFPLTGFAPTTVEEWLDVLNTAKSYGINHYRFHTCCPPEAAFIAADLVGIYMQPELPFWGTFTGVEDPQHNQAEQSYIINEGFSILSSFGNHPSFVMMSLGNELWGDKTRLDEVLKNYKEFDNRHLYAQGSNNFQFTPQIVEHDDFYSGVRFTRDRLIRGSYAMCDAPLGHVQTDKPSTMKDFDDNIVPTMLQADDQSIANAGTAIEIQFGTGTKTVEAADSQDQLIPEIPVVSHEIGQYQTYPDFNEIEKYTGSIKAKNFEVFKQRLEDKGLGHLAQKYFECSGELAVACYKEELESAFRSRKLAGFQLLDLQDFSGQGTALVGVLDAFMEPKGIVTEERWRSFCSDAVLMARFEKVNYVAEESFHAHVELCYYRNIPLQNCKLVWAIKDGNTSYLHGETQVSSTGDDNYIDICDIDVRMPNVTGMRKLTLSLHIEGTDIANSYDLWVYPNEVLVDTTGLNIVDSLSEQAIALLETGENVVLFPKLNSLSKSIEGFYSSDFWCYPMFRTISESMNKEVPVGTLGLLIDNTHPVFKHFPSEEYSTYPWWSIVSNSRSIILDGTPKGFSPIVQTIDNFERNHKLGLMFECNVLKGKLLLCACDFDKIIDEPEGKQLLASIINYVNSEEFEPNTEMNIAELKEILA
ncbi:sugar-binding domain-containing protein [Paenibacillus crassostreae]|uniref:beta-galactosidase n=1 Tax=Paenibacillus crassostreae TaxID=1763538 RepID=A0A167FZI6_9BACL|nr:sugar-binding domain-containing protein [Paenibacillus crassostreae]AOZ93913.1 beta-glucuronidase [Paenibacillus crassostreae]OAB77054.1 beta-glucuronidase [Paenibacillus crassostreae]